MLQPEVMFLFEINQILVLTLMLIRGAVTQAQSEFMRRGQKLKTTV